MRTGAALTAMLLLVAAGAAQADSPSEHAIAEGRYHLRKANGLAGDDRCQAAIHEYTLAFKKLRDPVVLFNRAECYRRIGEGEKAVGDYRAFLEAVPAAPNRAQIEAKVAALTAAVDAKPAPLAGPDRSNAPPPARPIATTPPPLPAERAPVLDDAPLPASTPSPPTVALVQAPPASAPSDGEGHRGRTWIWIAVGAAVAGGAVGAYFALRTPATTPPLTDLGNYKF